MKSFSSTHICRCNGALRLWWLKERFPSQLFSSFELRFVYVVLVRSLAYSVTHVPSFSRSLSLVCHSNFHFGSSSLGCCTDEIVKILVVVVIMMLMLTTLSSCATIRTEQNRSALHLAIDVCLDLHILVPLHHHIAIEGKAARATATAMMPPLQIYTYRSSEIDEERVARSICGRKDLQKKNRETRCNEIDEICITYTSSL